MAAGTAAFRQLSAEQRTYLKRIGATLRTRPSPYPGCRGRQRDRPHRGAIASTLL